MYFHRYRFWEDDKAAGITTIVFTGISTELGIESSAMDALNRDFYPVIVSDAVSSSDKMHALAFYKIGKGSWCYIYCKIL